MIKSPQGGNDMESEEMKENPPIGKDKICRNSWERVLVAAR
jgi:hypothetical protein